MAGIVLQHLGHEHPVLVDLRRHFHEVAVHVGALKSVEGCRGEHAVQRVAKLVEHGLHLVDREQRGRVLGGRRHRCHIEDDGAHTLALIVVLGVHLAHPCALGLGGTGEVVGHEHGHVLALLVLDIVDGHLWVVLRGVLHLGEGEAVEFVGDIENAVFHHAVQFKIGANVIVAEVELLGFDLSGIVIVVPRGNLEVGSVCVGIGLHVGHFFVHLLDGWPPELHEQFLGALHRLGHHGCHGIVGKGLIAQNLRFALAQFDELVDVGRVVVLVAAAGCVEVGLIHLLAQCAVVGVVEHRQARGPACREGILPGATLLGGESRSIVDGGL